jgi:GNAT superfamily N-acetyltransferase
VDEQIRSRGVGRLLLEAADRWARSKGCNAISVRSNVIRERAHQFYARNGFEHVKTQKFLFKTI